MIVWTISDLHTDYEENLHWCRQLSEQDYQEDFLVLAGDISHELEQLQEVLILMVKRFKRVFFVPGNHDVWLAKGSQSNSLQKFNAICKLAKELGASTTAYIQAELAIVPLFSWYDFSFGVVSKRIERAWVDFRACRWPMELDELTQHFHQLNQAAIEQAKASKTILSFSHFMPRADLLPPRVPTIVQELLPVFGAASLGEQIQHLQPQLHVYGHSHLNRSVRLDDVHYINNAFGYPQEAHICRKVLLPIYKNGQAIVDTPQWPVRPDE